MVFIGFDITCTVSRRTMATRARTQAILAIRALADIQYVSERVPVASVDLPFLYSPLIAC